MTLLLSGITNCFLLPLTKLRVLSSHEYYLLTSIIFSRVLSSHGYYLFTGIIFSRVSASQSNSSFQKLRRAEITFLLVRKELCVLSYKSEESYLLTTKCRTYQLIYCWGRSLYFWSLLFLYFQLYSNMSILKK